MDSGSTTAGTVVDGAEDYLRRMDLYHIEKALLLPANDQYLYYQDPNETKRFLGELVRKYPGRFISIFWTGWISQTQKLRKSLGGT